MASGRGIEEAAKQSEESLRKFHKQSMDGGRNCWSGGSPQRSRLCTLELRHQNHPPPHKVQPPINLPDQKADFTGGHGFYQRHGREGETIRRIIEKSHVLELLGSQLNIHLRHDARISIRRNTGSNMNIGSLKESGEFKTQLADEGVGRRDNTTIPHPVTGVCKVEELDNYCPNAIVLQIRS
ncbi:hypothetical protein L1887_30189 [Cichorium endivia]|nr:hypothetical protein L1887_30189 [Cichorium endivia]